MKDIIKDLDIPQRRSMHSLGVAQKMARITQNAGRPAAGPEAMFLLGWLHDFGYAIAETPEEHAHAGGLLLKSQGYAFWHEVYWHGDPEPSFSSPELWLLNYADLTVGPEGEPMSMPERIADIARRYGEEHPKVANAMKMAERLMLQGWS